jgi:hypothetical protein
MHNSTKSKGASNFISKMIGSLLLVLMAFPYVQIIPSSGYTQPFALMLGTLLFFINSLPTVFRLSIYDQIALIGLAILGLVVFITTCFPYTNSQEYKYLITYLSPLLLTIPLLHFIRHNPERTLYLLKLSIWIWIGTALIQKYVNPSFLGFLIGQWGESAVDIINSGRGVLGLAPEPTHHAFHILLLATSLLILDQSSRSRLLMILCVVDSIVLAASSSALLVLGISVIIWMLVYRQRWIFVALLFGLIVWSFSDKLLLPIDNRIALLMSAVLADPSTALSIDYSMNARLGGLYAVIMHSFDNVLVPFGMSVQAWELNRTVLLSDLPWLIDLSLVGPPSGIGMLLFQTGAVGGVLILMIFRRVLSQNVGSVGRILLISCPLIFLGQYYITAPTFAFIYACVLYRLNKQGIVNMSFKKQQVAAFA